MYINEGYQITPYPYKISGNKLSMVFPGGLNIEFTRNESVSSPAQQLSQSMARPATGNDQAAEKSFTRDNPQSADKANEAPTAVTRGHRKLSLMAVEISSSDRKAVSAVMQA